MTLTTEQRQEIIASLKTRYADGIKLIEEQESKGAYANMPQWLEEFKSANEKTKDLYERLESGEEVELGNGFNGGSLLPLFAIATLFNGFSFSKKGGE